MAVSECDWMIAGASEHLALAKAIQQGLEWPTAVQGNRTPNVKLELMLLGLPMRVRTMRLQLAQVPARVTGLRKSLNGVARMGPYRTPIEGQIRGFERMQREWEREIEICERVLADAKGGQTLIDKDSEVA